jgi:hypothetical protein
MKLEDIVVSRELAVRLREAGFKQRSNFYWYRKLSYPLWSLLAKEYDPKEAFEYEGSDPCEWVAAPTTDELLAALPPTLYDIGLLNNVEDDYILTIWKGRDWVVDYVPQDARSEPEPGRPQDKIQHTANRLVDALGATYIWLADHNLLEEES